MSRLISGVAILIAAFVPSSEVARSSCPPDIPRAGFTDVYPLSTHAFDIDCLAWRSIVHDEGEFGPREPLARWEMAAWLDSALRWVQDRYEIPQTTFLDTFGVPSQESIEALRKLDVTLGVGDNRFDPYGTVPRWQMALFLTRTYSAAGFRLPLATDQGFVDIAGHGVIAHFLGMKRLAMVAQINADHAKLPGQAARVGLPVLAGTEQAVQYHQRLAAARLGES